MTACWVAINGNKLLVTFVYAKWSLYEHWGLWNDLEALQIGSHPWLIMGDFNTIWEDGERIGGQSRPLAAIGEFNSCFNNCGVVDLDFHGGSMSWFNGHEGQIRKWAKLDRALVNVWQEPVHNSGLCNLVTKLKKVKIALKRWNVEEISISHIAKKRWLMEGDRNSKIFHAVVKQKLNSTMIESMVLEDGTVLESPEEIHEGAVRHFQNFLSTPTTRVVPDLSHLISVEISLEENECIVKEPSEMELKSALN
ncbi:hypothetical protein F2P56_015292 [Juglans regia]|uniref:Uncharacterized protein n=1 Tax=Juglans regia TaxID=51240 RepID=A0A833XFE6_JUGRE|nr:hypothetical protein F2P56_015292 [Juglans regia]